jgi:histone H3/H4
LKGVFPLLEIDRIIREAGAERVDERASRKLCEILEDNAKELVLTAKQFAKHAGRKRISRKDIVLAAGYLVSKM